MLRKILLKTAIVLPLVFGGLVAQTNNNMTVVAHIDDYPTVGYTDCWGYTAPTGEEYALLGTNAGISIVRTDDVLNIGEVVFVPWVNFGWYDMKTYQNYMYTSSEGSNSILVVDLSGLPDSVSVIGETGNFATSLHNIQIDTAAGLLFAVEDFNFSRPVAILSLADPENPVEISFLGSGLGTDAHDVFAQNNKLYVAEATNGTIGIFDISDPGNPVLQARINVPAPGYVHNVWVSADETYMITTEETPDKTIKVWDIQDPGNALLVGEYLGGSRLAHNAFLQDDYAIVSHYESGLKILDLTDISNPVEVANYDSYPNGEGSGFNGDWGVYPFSANGHIYISDIQTGLYVLTFDSVRAGGLEGTVTAAQSGDPLEGVSVEFLEAGIAVSTDLNGDYAARTFAGTHTVVYSVPGYFADTLDVTLPAGPSIIQNVVLDENLANISLSTDSISMVMPINNTATMDIIVSNNGPGGRLDYTVDDINGPVLRRASGHSAAIPRRLDIDVDMSGVVRRGQPPVVSGNLGDTIIVDPLGDLLIGSGGDIIGVYAATTADDVTIEFQFAETIDMDSAFVLFGVDLDFDTNTGAFPGVFGQALPAQNIGSDYDIFVNVPEISLIGNPALTVSIWPGSNTGPAAPPIYSGVAAVTDDILSFTIPLSVLDNDDGNMALAGFGGHIDPATLLATGVDFVPNSGNGVIGLNPQGDVSWLSLSREAGSLQAGESDTITVTFDSNGLDESSEYSGYIVFYSNDGDEPVSPIPVTLLTEPVLGIPEPGETPLTFELAQNYPNPFNPATVISYQLSVISEVRLTVFNLLGQEVAELVSERQPAGRYTVRWEGVDRKGMPVSSGVYFYQLIAGEFLQTRKMILMR